MNKRKGNNIKSKKFLIKKKETEHIKKITPENMIKDTNILDE